MNTAQALLFAQLSQYVYINQFNLRDFKLSAIFENKGTDTQGAFGISYRDVFTVIFRGSEETGVMDWITDLKFVQKVFPYAESNNRKVKVHYGFIQAYKSVREAVLQAAKETPHRQIICTGHSLGGALATLAALDIQYNVPGKELACYTYGSPKVGNKHFVNSYNRRVPKTYRLVNRFDIIPNMPPFGYRHVGELHHLDPDSNDDALANKVADHLPHNYVKTLRA